MPKLSEMIESKFLRKEDLDDDTIVTIRGVGQDNVGREDDPDYKWVLKLAEFKKPLVLNKTNLQLIAKACGSEDTDDWGGKKVILWVDDSVQYGGKLVGGIRVKAIKKAKPAVARSQNFEVERAREPGDDDDEPILESEV